ncbi:MAG: tRNA isopentenyl-2-thiomethyl-A-37 hydroxylase MiaE [Pseudomonadota bacterium]
MLQAATPDSWVDAAVQRWRELLVDHANCEKKAASTALSLMFAYPEDSALGIALARLAREELRHFEQVHKLMARMNVAPGKLAPGRYAGALRAQCRAHEPARRLDLMLCGALIEARSCERFELLAPRLPQPMGSFYADLAVAELRHQGLYLSLAQRFAESEPSLHSDEIARNLRRLAICEATLATSPDAQFRFHSGPPALEMAA